MRILPIGVACVLAACAQGTNAGDDDDDESPIDARRIDAPPGEVDAPEVVIDAPEVVIDAAIDAPVVIDAPPIDGPVIDAPVVIDAPLPIDAPPPIDAACSPTTTQILLNPNLDAAAVGSGWVQTPIDAQYPLITGDDGIVEHTAPYKAWLGGLEAPLFSSVTDNMYQQVTVPAGTTQLVVRGFYEVRTAEAASGTVYDSAAVELTNTSGTILETILTMGNPAPTGAWTPFQRTFTGSYAGQAVRLRFRSINDDLDPTSFYFDTLVLEATVGCP